MLEIFAAEGFESAHVYTFVNPGAPHVPERRYDMDIASFSLVKVIPEDYGDPASRYRWQPKQSFTALARHNC